MAQTGHASAQSMQPYNRISPESEKILQDVLARKHSIAVLPPSKPPPTKQSPVKPSPTKPSPSKPPPSEHNSSKSAVRKPHPSEVYRPSRTSPRSPPSSPTESGWRRSKRSKAASSSGDHSPVPDKVISIFDLCDDDHEDQKPSAATQKLVLENTELAECGEGPFKNGCDKDLPDCGSRSFW
mmetsp:Transcript_17659/g.25782  ORF Transcript_17659/g.25782 Transcript_17659/m.25782 type:complete len:182 (-) Transcript_17659:127-672(-)